MDWLYVNQQIQTWVDRFLTPIDDPTSRIFYLNFVFVFIFVIAWAIYTRQNISIHFLKKIFLQKKYWWNRSTRKDYSLYILNSVLKMALFIPFLDFSFQMALGFVQLMNSLELPINPLAKNNLNILLFSAFFFVFDDFLRFIHHYLMHKIPFLWSIHQTHHSAKILTPITLYRTHPVESAIATIRNSLSIGISTGVFVYLFQSQISFLTILGVHFMGFLFNFLGSNLRHSHIPISFGKIEKIFISPLQHQIHHSTNPEHFDSNFGVSLSIWDQLFGCCLYSKDISNSQKLRFGL